MKLRGSKIVIFIDDTPLALCRDVDFECSREMKEVASPSSGDAKEVIPGRYSWSMSSAHLIGNMNQNTLLEYLTQKTQLTIKIGTVTSVTAAEGSFSFNGTAYMKSFKMSAPLHGFATASCDFQGSGVLSIES